MYKSFFAALGGEILALPLLALIVFVAVFGGIVFRALRRPAAEYGAAAALPLRSDDEESSHAERTP
jgi:hypothetical protein